MKRAILLVAIGLSLFLLDLCLKAYVHGNIPMMNYASPLYPYGGIAVFQDWHGIDFSINHVVNRGAAWGIFSSFHEYLLYGRMLIIGGLISYLSFVACPLSRQIPLTLILSGAIGNVFDHFIYGHVVDMFYFNFWGHPFAVFNIADSAITVGISIMLITSLLNKKSAKPQEI